MSVHNFQADINELLNLIINAFYSNREVFLRELLSNASDAIDKKRHEDLSQQIVDKKYEIKISRDLEEKKLIIEDTGIGMDEQDLIQHLSTIAKSGTKEFVKQLKEKSDLIGQFGVGFYSSFLVADHVDVYTRKGDGASYKWHSDANQVYTIEVLEDPLPTGTKIVLHLKEESHDFLQEQTIQRVVSAYSQFITYPISLYVEREYPVEEEEVEEAEEADGTVVEEEEEEKEQEKKPPKMEKRWEWVRINGEQPLWYKRPNEPTESEYHNLYRVLSKDFEEPLYYRHFVTEGSFEFRGILYIPKQTPYNFMTDFSRDKRNIRLYAKKVMILPQLEKHMMADWMNFVCGVIDSSDLPLNVSREMLQQTKVLNAMKAQIKKQTMTMIEDLSRDKEKYEQFYDVFRKNIKLGIHEGEEDLLKYIRLYCNTKTERISLDEYLEKHCKPDQKSFYYMGGDDGDKSVFTKIYRDKGYNVLLFDEPIDEFMLQRVSRYKEKDFVNIGKDHQAPWEQEEDKDKEIPEEHKEFCAWFHKNIRDVNVESVRFSKTLTDANDPPCLILSSKYGWTGNMEKLMTSQPLNDNKKYVSFMKKKLIELNQHHPIISAMMGSYKEAEEETVKKAKLLYQAYLLHSGYTMDIENAEEFTSLLNEVLLKN